MREDLVVNTAQNNQFLINPIQDEPFRGCSRMGEKRAPIPKICLTYPTMMKLGTVILLPNEDPKNILIA